MEHAGVIPRCEPVGPGAACHTAVVRGRHFHFARGSVIICAMEGGDRSLHDGSRSRTAGLVAVAGIALVVVAIGSMLVRGRPVEVLYARWMLHNGPFAVVILLIGWAIGRRWPGHGLARVFLGIGAVDALHVSFMAYADARLVSLGLGTQPDLAFVPRDVPLDVSISF